VRTVTPNVVARRRGRIFIAGVACAVLWYAFLVFAYNPFQDQVAGVAVYTQWPNAKFTWLLNPATGSNVSTTNGDSVTTAVTNAINGWNTTQLVANGQPLTITNLVTQFGGTTSLTDPDDGDCKNIVSFVPSSSIDFPTGAVALTRVATAPVPPGQSSPCGDENTSSVPVSFIISADMAFNPKQNFSTTTPFPANQFDVQSTAAHEFGHALGLDHSGIAHAQMFPFGDTGAGQQRNLAVDDVIGISFIYPAANFASATGTISGKVTLDGNGIFASHVVAIDASTGAAVVDGLTKPDGTYQLIGVPPGTYYVLVLPLAPDMNSGIYTLDDFSGWVCGYATDASACTGIPANPTNYTGKFF
jgi:hypothetical protein